MILASNSVKAFRVSVAPSEFISNVAEFGNPMFRLESLNPKESGDAEEKLPEGYTRVGWIAGAGDALLNTGYYPNHNSEILIDRSGLMDYTFGMFGYGSYLGSSGLEGYMIMGVAAYGEMAICICGALSSDTAQPTMFPLPHDAVEWYPSGENPFEGYESEIAETRYSIYMSKDELSVGGVSRPNPATPALIDPWPIPFTLFGSVMFYGSDIEDEPMPDMIFSFKVSENGVPVVNMLPCIEDATGQPGFYDTVRGIFITGEGMFFTGEAPEPVEPEPLPENLYTFNDCTHYSQVGEIYPDYLRRISDWNYYLNDLQIGGDEDGALFSRTNGSANTTLKTFSVDLPSLTDGYRMFDGCVGLTSWDIELPALTDGYGMFAATGLTSFTGDLPKLTDGNHMFYYCTGLTSFNADLPALTNVNNMFSGCTKLTSFEGDMPALTNGYRMFYDCTGLTSFEGDLSSLTYGAGMFSGCKLDAPSVLNIAESINDEVVDAPLGIGIDCSSDMSELDSFARDIYYEDWSDLCRTFYDKGWTVTWGDTDGNSTTYTKYIDCVNVSEVTAVNSNYKNDLRNNKWVYWLPNLTDGEKMFYLCTKLTSWDIELPNLTDGSFMFGNTELTSWDIELPKLTNGVGMFINCNGLTSWDIELPALTDGERMFFGCTGLTSFTGDLSALTDGSYMFYRCTGLTSWDIELPNLTDCACMFQECTKLTSFNVDLPALTDGNNMFYRCTGLTSWDIELPNLTSGNYMFRGTGLTSWDIELPNLTDGGGMFSGCTGLTSWDIELPKLTDGEEMFSGCTGLTSFNVALPALTNGWSMFEGCTGLTSWDIELPKLSNGYGMFEGCTGLTSWDIELPNLTTGWSMFEGCTGLTSWDIELPNLTNCRRMFYNCTGLTSFNIDLSALTDGSYMFGGCSGLTSWDIELPNLTDGNSMFQNTRLTSWDIDLPNLTDGYQMFSGCTGLTSWDIELPNLDYGGSMFNNCTGLTSFNVDLPALTSGYYMFGSDNTTCTKLDLASVQRMANTINDLASAGKTGNLYLGMDASLQDTEDLETALASIRAKGWTVTEMYRS